MNGYIEGQPIKIRSELTETEWFKFGKECGLFGDRQRTQITLTLPATWKGLASHRQSFIARFQDGKTWYVPIWLLNTEPRDKKQQVIDKIKYLDNRFKQRKTLSHEH